MGHAYLYKKYDNKLNVLAEKKYSCGGCGKKRRKNSQDPWTMENRDGKIIWKNNAYKQLEAKENDAATQRI